MKRLHNLPRLWRSSWGVVTDYAFTKGLLIVAAIISVVAVGSYLGDLGMGVSCAVGVFLVSICDLPGNKVDHFLNMVLGLLIAVVNVMAIQFTLVNLYFNLATLAVLVFLTAYLSALGKRASLISFSGLLALVLAYAFPKAGWDIAWNGLYLSLGGLWFIFLNVLVHPLRYRRYRLGLLNEGLTLTADYLSLKSRQLHSDDPDTLWPDLIIKHNAINEIRKVLTDYFLGQSPDHDTLGKQSREGVLYLELVDLLELGAAVPVRPETDLDQEFIAEMAGVLTAVASGLRRVARRSDRFRTQDPERLQARLARITSHLRSAAPEMDDDRLHLAYLLYDNLEKQVTKLRSIESLADAREEVHHMLYTRESRARLRERRSVDYSVLKANLSTDSAVFRHCARLSLVILAGYLLGWALGVHNAYWIILTVVVIMRPTYVQSKDRSVQRTVGTLAGALVAAAVVAFTDSHVIYAVVGGLSMPFVFIFLDRDYRVSAFFVTLNLVFTYALLHPDAYTVITYRVVDTLIGAGLAFSASRLLWPAWDSRFIAKPIAQALAGITEYLREESSLYLNRRDDSLAYRIARRNAFVALGELDASYARVLKEPGRKQITDEELSRLVTNHHRILSSIAWLGTYLQYHAVSVSHEHFSVLVDDLCNRLLRCKEWVVTARSGDLPALDIDTSAAMAYFRSAPVEAGAVAHLQEKRLFLREYTYLRALIGELDASLCPLTRLLPG